MLATTKLPLLAWPVHHCFPKTALCNQSLFFLHRGQSPASPFLPVYIGKQWITKLVIEMSYFRHKEPKFNQHQQLNLTEQDLTKVPSPVISFSGAKLLHPG